MTLLNDNNLKSDSLSAPDSTEGTSDSDDVDHKSHVDFGSCVAVITVNDRLMVIRTPHRSVDVCMSSKNME